jgi:hypothetical protein
MQLMKRAFALIFAASLLVACSSNDDPPSQPDGGCEGPRCDAGAEVRSMCAAIRGNGDRVFAHFASLARIVEHYGPLGGAAGGSSASITIFLIESIQRHPLVVDCGGSPCSAREQADRIALLLKSMQGYAFALGESPEALAVQHLAPLAQRIREAGIVALLETDIFEARDALLVLLESEDLRALINGEILDLLTESADPTFHIVDIVNELESFGSFAADDPAILVRPGVLDFEAFAEMIGRIGSFYAGRGPMDEAATQAFFSECAGPGRGLIWHELAELPATGGTCGEVFHSLVTDWREGWLADGANYPSRIDDPIGESLPALVSTSVLQGDAVEILEQARADYVAAEPYSLDGIDFADIRFGYWGAAADLERVGSNPRGYDDLKTAKMLALGETTWRTALSLSPAEPGLARALEIDEERVSAGGWSDLHPVLVLKNLGCDEVIYVTRRGSESRFAQGVASLLGMQDADRAQLYDLEASSSFVRSLEEADAVYCTDWDNMPALDLVEMYEHAYNAPLESSRAFFTAGDDPYAGVVASTDYPGCTPGAF